MTVSVRQLIGAVVVSFCVGAFITPVWTQVQGEAKPAPSAPAAAKQATYMTVEFMAKASRGCLPRVVRLNRSLPAARD